MATTSIFTKILSTLSVNNKSWLAQVLAGAGLGLASTASFNAFVDYYKSQAISNFGQLGAVSGLLGLSGVDRAISMIIGAHLAGVYIKTFATGLRLIKK